MEKFYFFSCFCFASFIFFFSIRKFIHRNVKQKSTTWTFCKPLISILMEVRIVTSSAHIKKYNRNPLTLHYGYCEFFFRVRKYRNLVHVRKLNKKSNVKKKKKKLCVHFVSQKRHKYVCNVYCNILSIGIIRRSRPNDGNIVSHSRYRKTNCDK